MAIRLLGNALSKSYMAVPAPSLWKILEIRYIYATREEVGLYENCILIAQNATAG